MRNRRFGLPRHLLALATMGPQLLNDGGGGDGGGGGGGGGGTGGGGGGEHGPVPYHVFQKTNHQLRDAQAKNQQLQGQITELTQKAATVDTVTKTFEDSKQAWEKERAGFQERLELSDLGLSSKESRTVARSLYNSLDEDTRGKTSLADTVKAWKEKPDEAPAGMRAYFGGDQAAGGGTRRANKGTKGGKGGADDSDAPITAEAVRKAREKALNTGDRTEYDALVKAYQAQQHQ